MNQKMINQLLVLFFVIFLYFKKHLSHEITCLAHCHRRSDSEAKQANRFSIRCAFHQYIRGAMADGQGLLEQVTAPEGDSSLRRGYPDYDRASDFIRRFQLQMMAGQAMTNPASSGFHRPCVEKSAQCTIHRPVTTTAANVATTRPNCQ